MMSWIWFMILSLRFIGIIALRSLLGVKNEVLNIDTYVDIKDVLLFIPLSFGCL